MSIILTLHKGWINDINETQNTVVNYPIIADADQTVANLYGMIHPNANAKVTVRTVFVIDPDKKLRLTLTYPPSTGRNFNEILRALDSLQLTDNYSVATPVDWADGDDVVVAPSIPTADAKQKFPKGVTEIKPYLRDDAPTQSIAQIRCVPHRIGRKYAQIQAD